MKYTIIPVLIICISLLWKCEPCADCGKPVVFDPNIRMMFIDYDSLGYLDTTLLDIEDSLEVLSNLRDSLADTISVWNSLLIAYRDSIENGNNDYADDTVDLVNYLALAGSDLSEVDTANKYTELYQTDLTTARAGVVSGNILVDNILILENIRDTTYLDSAELYTLPLLMESNFTTYQITILGKLDTIGFSYNTEFSTNADRKVRMRAKNITMSEYTYQIEPEVECNTDECLDNEVLVTIYF